MGYIREIWGFNMSEEMWLINQTLYGCSFISMDTEFPGFLRHTPRFASEAQRYAYMKFNVENTKLIQFGFTLFNADGTTNGTWEVNFSDFEKSRDAYNQNSIDFLKRNGLNLNKIRVEGVRMEEFFGEFSRMLQHHHNKKWVTFHGNYDLAYVLKIVDRKPLPETSEQFADAVGRLFGGVYDPKAMASRCSGLNDQLGLENLANTLGVTRTGTAHHAGSDSLLTAVVFVKLLGISGNLEGHEGFIYGISRRVVSTRLEIQTTFLQNTVMSTYHGGLSMSATVSPYGCPVFPSPQPYNNYGYYMFDFFPILM